MAHCKQAHICKLCIETCVQFSLTANVCTGNSKIHKDQSHLRLILVYTHIAYALSWKEKTLIANDVHIYLVYIMHYSICKVIKIFATH